MWDALKTEELALSQLLGDEHSRWNTFNVQVEELERAAAGRMAPQPDR